MHFFKNYTSLITSWPRSLQLFTFWLSCKIDMDSSWIKVRRLRKAYQRVFMPTITSKSSFEDRLAELVRILAHHRFTSICACIYLNLNQQEQEVELSESPAVSCMVESIRMSFVQGHRGICKFRSWNSSWMCQFLNYLGSYLRRYLGNLVQHCYFFLSCIVTFLVMHELWHGGFQTFSVMIKSWVG